MNTNQIESEQKYIKKNVMGVLEKLTIELIERKPDDSINFMIQWLEENGDKVYRDNQKNANRPDGMETSNSEDNDEEINDEFEVEFQKKSQKKKESNIQRKSVSAEVYGVYNKKEDFVPKVIEKDLETKDQIRQLLNKNFLFSQIEVEDKEIIINAMERRLVVANAMIIKQGDDGNEMFIVASGSFKCTRNDNGKEIFLRNYEVGEYFGELALLYNCSRAANIYANTQSVIYSLDRECFNHIVKDSVIKNRNIYEKFLADVEILSSLESYERSKLCDCLQVEIIESKTKIIKEGEFGDRFYLIVSGEAEALKFNPSTNKEEVVNKYTAKMYFGELSLIKEEPRAATIVSTVIL